MTDKITIQLVWRLRMQKNTVLEKPTKSNNAGKLIKHLKIRFVED
ncbi:MAG: hypothetical protein QXY22_00020 [Candidatus Nitrosotenuis sp.]